MFSTLHVTPRTAGTESSSTPVLLHSLYSRSLFQCRVRPCSLYTPTHTQRAPPLALIRLQSVVRTLGAVTGMAGRKLLPVSVGNCLPLMPNKPSGSTPQPEPYALPCYCDTSEPKNLKPNVNPGTFIPNDPGRTGAAA